MTQVSARQQVTLTFINKRNFIIMFADSNITITFA